MRSVDWLQLGLFVVALALITKPMGLYLLRVLDANGRTWLDPMFKPLERVTYRLMGVKPDREQSWKEYTFAMLLFSLVGCLFTYAILRLQHLLPLNPQGFGSLSPDLAFNTATSFTTNTNWQSYTGEATMSYLSQMVALVIHNFTSAAVGIAIAAALVRGIARHSAQTLGNFWVDLVRVTYFLLLPICTVFAVVLLSLVGASMVFLPYPLKMEASGHLYPAVRRNVCPPEEGVLLRFNVEEGEQLLEHRPLALMFDSKVRTKMETLRAEADSAGIEAREAEVQAQKPETSATEKPTLLARAQIKRAEQTNKQQELQALITRIGARREAALAVAQSNDCG